MLEVEKGTKTAPAFIVYVEISLISIAARFIGRILGNQKKGLYPNILILSTEAQALIYSLTVG